MSITPASLVVRKIRRNAAPAGRPRALSRSKVEAIQLAYIALMDRKVREKWKSKLRFKITSQFVIETLARFHGVSERVVVDVIRRRGAYRNAPLSAVGARKLKIYLGLTD